MGVNSLPKTVTQQRRGCNLNPGPSAMRREVCEGANVVDSFGNRTERQLQQSCQSRGAARSAEGPRDAH